MGETGASNKKNKKTVVSLKEQHTTSEADGRREQAAKQGTESSLDDFASQKKQ